MLATGNHDKAREIGEILAASGDGGADLLVTPVEVAGATVFLAGSAHDVDGAVRALPELAVPPGVEESGATIEENARIKAQGWCDALGIPAIADDTGLEVDALGGAPGVRAARYAGETATYADNVAKLLDELAGVAQERRTCRFVTAALARFPGGREVVARGEVEGVVTEAPRGAGGFGYDPVFRPCDGDGRTFAEMTAEEKHSMSHRGRAFRALAAALGDGAED